jgi:hypothetical protein
MAGILFLDCFAGISGDMTLAALLDAGVEESFLRKELAQLGLGEEYELTVSREQKMGMSGTRVEVKLLQDDHSRNHSHGHHAHRNLGDIERIIDASALPAQVKEDSKCIFTRIAEAEAKVHGTTVSEVHFHEVGAVDSIVDIVGAAICFNTLDPGRVISRPPELGGGFVRCAHGTLPVPAPATAEILKGIPSRSGGVDSEATTPTGAAIIAHYADEFSDAPAFKTVRIGCGIGHKDFAIPNVLRVFLAEETADIPGTGGLDRGVNYLIECTMDDMNPEDYEVLMQQLFDAGALDVYIQPVIMKKSRPAHLLSVLCADGEREVLVLNVLAHSSSFGLRVFPVEKYMLQRRILPVQTSYGEVRVKFGCRNGRTLKMKAEYEDCRRLAASAGVRPEDVRREALAAAAASAESACAGGTEKEA